MTDAEFLKVRTFPVMEPVPEVRCKAGQDTYPLACNRHSEHYWCIWCAGYYGVEHHYDMEYSCHMGNPASFPRGGHCACRFCEYAHIYGMDAALKERERRHANG